MGAALIELSVPEADSIKARRRVSRALVDRLRHRFNASVAELGDPDDRHSVLIGCVMLGRDPRRLRASLERAVRYVESLGLAELVADDITLASLDELDEFDPEGRE